MKKIIIASLVMLIASKVNAANLNLGASSLRLKVYTFSVSTSPLCTNLKTIVDNSNNPQWVDFVGSVNLGSGPISSGSYECVVIEFADNIKFTPDQNSTNGNCQATVEQTMDVCRGGMGTTSVLIDGSTATCTNNEDKVAMYLSTTTDGSGGDAFNPPASIGDNSKGMNLAAAMVVSGSASGKFVVNPAGKVCDGDDGSCDGGFEAGQCRMEPPTFGFEQY